MKRFLGALVATACIAASPAQATDPNVLLGKSASAVLFGSGSLTGGDFSLVGTLTDGIFLAEQTNWQTGTVWWQPSSANFLGIQIDLGGSFILSAFKVQVDNNENYRFEYFDGTWNSLASQVPGVIGFGMMTRDVVLAPGSEIVASALRLFPLGGDGAYAASEIQAFGVPVPEPGTYLMMLAGIGFLGFMVRRRISWR